MQWVLLIHRPEAMGDLDNELEILARANFESPFDGIETYGVYANEPEVLALADRLHAEHPQWSFHMEAIRQFEKPAEKVFFLDDIPQGGDWLGPKQEV